MNLYFKEREIPLSIEDLVESYAYSEFKSPYRSTVNFRIHTFI